MMMKVRIIADNDIPCYATTGSAGMDISSNVSLKIPPKDVELVGTGIKVEIPEGMEAQIRTRSGLSLKHKIFVINSPGTIDSDYRGEIKILLANFGADTFVVEKGMRIAQMVFAKYEKVCLEPVVALSTTSRGSFGFGHSGLL